MMVEDIWDEKYTKKYRDAVILLRSLEKEDTLFGKSVQEIKGMEPREVYSYLYDEWWREWNGLLQEWQKIE